MPETAIQADESETLCEFARRNKKTGRAERLRVVASDYGGRIYLQCRVWFAVQARDDDDAGWRPDRERGLTIHEGELDQLADAVERARAMVHQQGRSTAADPTPPRKSRAAR